MNTRRPIGIFVGATVLLLSFIQPPQTAAAVKFSFESAGSGERFENLEPEVVDFRYRPAIWQSCLSLPDDPHKTVIGGTGQLGYDFHKIQGRPVLENFWTRLTASIETAGRTGPATQELHSARIPIVTTTQTIGGLEFKQVTWSGARAAMLTGQAIWRLEHASVLLGYMPPKFPVYPDLLEEAGYHVGYINKGYAPGGSRERGRNPCGPRFEGLATRTHASYSDIDASPTKAVLVLQREDPGIRPFFESVFGRRPARELFDRAADPAQLRNLAAEPAYAAVVDELDKRLMAELARTGDPRALGCGSVFDDYSVNPPSWERARSAK